MLNNFGRALTGMALNAIALAAIGWVAWDTYDRGVLEGVSYRAADISVEDLGVGRSEVDVNAIVRAHLFGREPRNDAPVVEKAAPPTRLNLKLVGVISLGSDTSGLALIETGRGKQEVIRVGEPIGTTGARLSEVSPDHVLIERNGQLERLAINRPRLDADSFRAIDGGPGGSVPGAPVSLGAAGGRENLPAPSPLTVDAEAAQAVADTTIAADVLPDDASADAGDPAGVDGANSSPGGIGSLGPAGDLVLPFSNQR